MSLTPNDIRNYEFPGSMRGYAREAVDTLIEQVANSWEQSKQEILKLQMENDSLKTQLAGLKQFEDTIKNAAIDARRNADQTLNQAKAEAEKILEQARNDSQRYLEERNKQIPEIENQITKLELTKRSYLNKLRGLIQSHLEMVDEVVQLPSAPTPAPRKTESPEQPEDQLEVTESTDVTRTKRETIATKPSQQSIKTEEANAEDTDKLKKAMAAAEVLANQSQPETQPAPPAVEDEAPNTPAEADTDNFEQLRQALQDEGVTDSAPAPAAPQQTMPPQEAAPAPPETEAASEEQTAPEEQAKPAIDPELAAALAKYQQQQAAGSAETPAPQEPAPSQEQAAPAASQDQAVPEQPAMPAPEGFVSNNQEATPPPAAPSNDGSMNITNELDDVVKRFEETMDEAEKN